MGIEIRWYTGKVALKCFHVRALLRRLALDHVKAEFHDAVVRPSPTRAPEEAAKRGHLRIARSDGRFMLLLDFDKRLWRGHRTS